MHEGDHGILEDAQEEFDEKFGCRDCSVTGSGHEHPHNHSHGHDHPHPHYHSHDHVHADSKQAGNGRVIRITAVIAVAALVAVFIALRVL